MSAILHDVDIALGAELNGSIGRCNGRIHLDVSSGQRNKIPPCGRNGLIHDHVPDGQQGQGRCRRGPAPGDCGIDLDVAIPAAKSVARIDRDIRAEVQRVNNIGDAHSCRVGAGERREHAANVEYAPGGPGRDRHICRVQ